MTETPALPPTRRVITGLDAEGRSAVLVDGPARQASESGVFIWRTDSVPADNSAREDYPHIAFDFDQMHAPGSVFMVHDFAVGIGEFWHATDTIDYIVVLSGEVVLQLEAGEVRLRPGDCVVDRGVSHSWRNDGPEIARAAIIAMPALPVGAGSTV